MNKVELRSSVDPGAGRAWVRRSTRLDHRLTAGMAAALGFVRSRGLDRALRATQKPLRLFAGARDGVVAVELGLIGLPFFMMISFILVLAFMTFCSSTLDYAAQKGMRQLMVGTATNANLTADQFRTTVICPLLPTAAFDCSKVVVNLTTLPLLSSDQHGDPNAFARFVNASQTGLIIPPLSNSQGTFCTGAKDTYSLLQVLYPMPIFMSLFATAPQVVNGSFVLMSSVAFKNEPFQGSNASTGC